MSNTKILITPELRLCEISNTIIGYFHCWEHYSHNGECKAYGLVETVYGMIRIEDPSDIQFIDEKHNFLNLMNQGGIEHVRCEKVRSVREILRCLRTN